MRNFVFVILSLTIGHSVYAATSQVSNVVNAGGASNSSLFPAMTLPSGFSATSLTMLVSGSDSSSGGNYYGFYRVGGTGASKYKVDGAKTFYSIGFYYRDNGSSQKMIGLSQSTANPGFNNSVEPAGIIYNCVNGGTSANAPESCGYQLPSFAAGASEVWVPTTGLTFTAGYYPLWQTDSGSLQVSIRMIGYEQ
jgi:hypothetical protein